ncbi:MAG: hypothetical protein RRY21_01325 [Oscillospiraceae bacterium]
MRRDRHCSFAAVAGAFGLGLLLSLTCSFRLALIFAAALLVVLGWSIIRWHG